MGYNGFESAAQRLSPTIRDAAGNNATLTHSTVAANPSYLVDTTAPTVSDTAISIANASGVGTSQVLQNGDLLTAIWDPTGNSDVATVTVDFSAFGGSATAAATLQSSGFYSGKYTASYTIGTSFPAGTNRNVAFTVVDTAGNSTTTSDSSNATINNNPLLQNQTLNLPFGSVANGVTVVDVNDANTGSDQSIAAQNLTFSITGGNTNNAFAIDPATGSISVADASKISSGSNFSLTVQASEGSNSSSATVALTFVNSAALQTGTTAAETITGSALDELIKADAGNDSINAAAGNDLVAGGAGTDTMTGGTGQDAFYNPIADQSISFSGTDSGLLIASFDSITDFRLGSGTASGDVLKITSIGVSPFIPVNQTAVDGTNSATGYTMANGSVVALHSFTNGIATFSTNTTFSAVAIASLRDVAAVTNYLSRNDLGPAGTTVAFTTSSFTANSYTGVRTFVYTQTSDQSAPGTTANSFALVELRAVTATSLTTNASAALSGSLIIASNINPFLSTSSSPALTGISEDVADASNTGSTVATIVGSSAIVDLDSSVTQAIALTEVDSRNGTWQYKLSGGSTWTAVASDLSPVKALLLDSADSLRFVPNANYNGSATFNFKAWDKSIGSAGNYASTAAVQSGLFAEVFDYSTTSTTSTSLVTPGVPSPNGSTGASALGTLVTRRVDNQINIIDNGAYGAYANDNATFAVRWTGQVLANQSSITFFTNSDDGVRLWVNGTSVINNWTDHAQVTDSGTVTGLTAGQWYDIQMDYYQNQVNTIAKLAWGDINTV